MAAQAGANEPPTPPGGGWARWLGVGNRQGAPSQSLPERSPESPPQSGHARFRTRGWAKAEMGPGRKPCCSEEDAEAREGKKHFIKATQATAHPLSILSIPAQGPGAGGRTAGEEGSGEEPRDSLQGTVSLLSKVLSQWGGGGLVPAWEASGSAVRTGRGTGE